MPEGQAGADVRRRCRGVTGYRIIRLRLPVPAQLYRAMDRLPEKEKASISLFYFEDRSIKEIAAILGIPQGTVKYHLSMGRTHLKQHIQL